MAEGKTPTRDDTDVVGYRIAAHIIDSILIFLGSFTVLLVFGITSGIFSSLTGDPGSSLAAIFTVIGALLGLVVFFGYNFIFEAFWKGRTPGKKLFGIKVVEEEGSELGLGSAFVRNIPAPFSYVIYTFWLQYTAALASMAASDRRQRLFDRLAGTVVVDEDWNR